PVRKAIRILDLLNLGTVSIKGGNYTRWNELGNPREWRATIRMADGGNVDDVLIRPPRTPESQAILRLDRMGDGAFRRALVEVSKPVRLRVLAVGEYAADDLGFADGAWIEDADECSRAWEMTLVNTAPAGGAQKNRAYDNLILLEPGNYLACYGTDDSHAYDEWNAPPPYDPESWGLTLIPEAPLAPGTVKVTLDPAEKNVIAQLAPVGDSEYREQEFYLSHAAQVCIRAYGEWDAKQGRYYDFGWIEDAYTLRPVWTMETNPGHYASGEARNRMVEDKLALEPGLYRVAYVTDDGHAYGNWSSHPPFEPAAWGIRLCGLGEGFSMQWVSESAPQKDSPALIRLAPLESGVHKRIRFRVDGPTRVKLIAMGEGDDGDMYDYGWLVDEDSGETIWKMKYEDTQPAGGARKNRRVEHELTLQPGTYSLNATTDGSHAFGDWNDDVPRDFHLWGITLVEVASR
ncbi:MAG: hypothetical protein V1774_02120, partial [Candidatus Eisenbacteria bacterium]